VNHVRYVALTKRSRRHNKPMFTCLPDSSHSATAMIARDTATVYKTGPMIVVGLPKLRILRQHPIVGSAPPRVNSAKDKMIQRVASSWRYPRSHRADPISSSFVFESSLGGFLYTLPCGLALSHPDSPDRDYPRMKH
jgi:hypothetical protein